MGFVRWVRAGREESEKEGGLERNHRQLKNKERLIYLSIRKKGGYMQS